MDKFIRHVETKLYLTEDGHWTSDLAQAWCVKDLGVAVDRILALGHYDVELCHALAPGKNGGWDYMIPFR